MVPFQPAQGRQGKGQPSSSGTYRSVNILHSFSASKNSSAGEARRSQSESLWLETTDKCTGLQRSNKPPKSAMRSFPLILLLALLFPSLIHTEGRKTHLFKLILSAKSQVFSFQVALTEVFSVCQNILKNCLLALVVLFPNASRAISRSVPCEVSKNCGYSAFQTLCLSTPTVTYPSPFKIIPFS